MQLTAGSALGPYVIVERIGAGGMGTVYRARDTRLDRAVAIKVLSEELSKDPRMRERLAREARAVSALSHPNICALYDVGSSDGTDYMVMELLDGESLAERLGRGPLPLAQALRYGAEIARALEAAHRAGVVHRDLKPGNVMLTKSGARLLDFGLAKQQQQRMSDANTDAATEQAPLTEPGVAAGTLQYMSPEQIEGSPLDTRSDIFSFGAMLYEMLSGRRAFDSASRSEVISRISREEPPPLRIVAPAVPESLDRVVRKCLAKDRDDRWQSARDLGDDLTWIAADRTDSGQSPVVRPHRRNLLPWSIAAVAVLAAMSVPLLRRQPHGGGAPAVRFSLDPPPGAIFTQRATNNEFAVSPDGTRIAFTAVRGGHRSLYLRTLDALSVREFEGSDGAMSPFWSPDSRWVGFFANGFMKKVPAAGGAVQTICKASGGSASWGSHGLILFAEWGPHASEAIESVPEDGGATRPVTDEHLWHFWPEFLPDGEHFLYRLINGSDPESGLYIASLDRSAPRRLMSGTSRAEVTRDGWLYFVRDGALVKQQLDVKTARLLGQPVTLAQPVFTFTPTANANFSVDERGGVVAYQRTAADAQLVWRDIDGHELGRLSPVPHVRSFSISPDGRRVAIERFESSTGVSDIWLYDIGRDVLTRVTANPYGCFTPIWTRDGHELVVTNVSAEQSAQPPQIARLSLSGAKPRQLLEKEDGVQFPTDVLRDSSAVLYTVSRGSQKDIELISFGDLRREPIESSPFNESDGVISPDGRSIAFTSDESGRPEIYIAPFRRGGEKTLVSVDGGTEPHWSADGRKLYYFRSGMLMSASVSATGVGRPVPMFPLASAGLELEEFRLSHYDVAPDGKRFLVRELAPGGDADPLTLIVTNPDH